MPVTPPIQTPIAQAPIVSPQTGQWSLTGYQWAEAVTTFLGNGVGPNVPTLTVMTFLALLQKRHS